ncbi:plexin-D1 isoform X4 [Trachypithecus francoisi]|uniref:plexin-D1 isoform X4 n=1 Tax=Trachypithecus francoisi TaxID=54180 RepID=UPI00141BBD55|nr:plexin-D1 isoform X4 [Trachypithecus francoisi]
MAPRAAGGAPLSARAAAASPPPFPTPPRCPVQLLLLLLLGAARAGALEIQRRFPSPTPTNNFALDGAAGTVYLAAVNRLYQLSGANLSLEAEAAVGPVPDSPLCHAPQLPQASCEHPRRLTDNYNKILQLDPGQGLVVVCGSIYQGFCQLRRRGNISAVAVRFPPAAPPAEPVTVFPSMLNVAANHPNASTVGLVLPPAAGAGGSRLLVGATYTGYGSSFFPRNRSLEDHRFENTPEIAIRSLDARGDLAKLFTFDLNPSDDNILKIKQGAKEQHKLGFVSAFLHPPDPPPGAQPYAYLALNSEARAGDKESQARSLLARICLPHGAGSDAKKLTESYIQLGLQCAGGAGRGDLYSRLVSVFPARERLFAVFERPQGSPAARAAPAALCAFRFADVRAAIRAARTACFVEPAPDVVAVLDSVVQGTGPACERKRNIQLQPEQLDCGAAHLQHPLSILQPLKATPVFRAPGLTSVAVASVNNYTAVFLGTVNGRLLKSPQDCPRTLLSPLAPVPTGGSQNILVPLANAAFFQGTALECSFGLEEIFEAVWVNESIVRCDQVVLHTTQKSQVFPLSLQLKGQPARFLDSPEPMTVVVYNCAMGSPDCSQCLGREDLGHLCVWSDGCRLRGPLQPMPGTCPAPEIRAIEPLSGPLDGGTLLTIRGRNLGRRLSDVAHGVWIGGVACEPLPDRYTVSEEIVCVTGPAPGPLSDIVTVNASKEGKSRDRFSYVLPLVHSLEPPMGPKAGGTRITIHGNDLHVGSELQVLVNDTDPCTELMRTDTSITCTVPEGALPAPVPVCVRFERRGCVHGNLTFWYMQNPVITAISPRRSPVSGGRTITVAGERFHMVQNVSMAVHHIGREPTLCKVLNSTLITCPSPGALSNASAPVDFFINGRAYADEVAVTEELLDPEEAQRGSRFRLDYLPNPQFSTAKREKWIKHHPGEPLTLVIHKEQDSLGLQSHEYRVKIGQVSCDIQIVSDRIIHCSVNESLGAAEGQLPITIQVGNFNQTIATLQLGGSETAIVVSIVICSVLLLLSVVALFIFCTKSRRAERYWQKTLLQMEEMESQIREEIRKGFAELQTDMTDLTKELNRSQGIPFLEYKHFVTRTFFPKCSSLYEERYVLPSQTLNSQGSSQAPETHPLLGEWKIPESCRPNMEEGISLFSSLLNNKHFLIVFVHALEQQKDFAVRDRCSLASLLTIALHGKLEYYTSIMKELLVDLIDASAAKNPKLMLRRTESVVEKMLTNWMSICMYSCLRETVGEPFFLLLCAIKQQINKGSIDAITGKARYTLNEEWLLRENIEAKPRNLNVSFQGCGMDSLSVRAMDTDTLTQVKEKILEAFCKNVPYSQWPRAEDVDLEWFASSTQSYILRDLDDTSVVEDGRKKLNTLAHYKIPEGASLAMSLIDKKDNTLGRVKDLDTEKYFHLVLPTDELAEPKKSHRQSHRKKVLPEIYLTRLLSTKGTLQKFLDDLFKAILSIREDKPPLAVKYFFDFLEEQAEKRGISDPDTLHIWKTNSLPLRFWVNILKNPQFVFDIDKTDHIDACLSVIAQAFIDACSISDLQLGKDSPTNKLLYAKEIPEYRKIVQRYYKQIQDMTPLSEQEMNAHLAEESRKYQNEFNTNVAMAEIYKYAKRYRPQIMAALEANPTARRTQLQHKFEQVVALMEDNIYECYSEA